MPASPPTIGCLAQVACTWEVLARKAGNVCPGREFPDLTVNDFLVSAAAIAPILNEAPTQPLGVTILRAIEATRRVVKTNTNLGIVLLLAPLASVPLGEPLCSGLSRVLEQTTVEDARNVFTAIRLAKPGGLGTVQEADVYDEPTLPLRDVMALANERDLIAAQYEDGFLFVFNQVLPQLARRVEQYKNIERAIVETQMEVLRIACDSHIHRKLGSVAATEVKLAAQAIGGLETPAGRRAFGEFDAWLRADNHARNPGTTADLIAAGLFAALREKRIAIDAPFVWEDHPFSTADEHGAAEPQLKRGKDCSRE